MKAALAWLRRWGISAASLLGGLLALFVFRREVPHVGWIVGYVVLLGLLFAIVSEVRQALEAKGRRLVVTAVDYTIQTLHHGLLLFLLPAYWASTTLSSVNAFFFLVLVGMALVATFDPWYQALVGPRPWLATVFLVVSVFSALNLALPLVGVPPYRALLFAAWAAVVALSPMLRRARQWSWTGALAITAVAGLLAAGLASAGRLAIPPAPVALATGAIARDINGLEPVGAVEGAISVSELRQNNGVFAYTAVYAPAGLWQPITHVWRRNGRVQGIVKLTAVRGGRREGFRTFSRKIAFPMDPVGRWSVDIMTGSGQLIGRLRFRVTR
ncbi:MAG: DUF2914 domain-containing protein [Candidatus Rokubacteria bacterium]|nr:DUF2914 domain-containing protein [Candidatus Rokubacteria bacterium]